MIFLNTPNNPTGQLIPIDDLRRIADAAPHAVVLIDEAYIEFGGQTFLPELPRYPNVLSAGRSRRRTGSPACASASSSASRRRSIPCAR